MTSIDTQTRLVSIMVPSRGRIQKLDESLTSLEITANNYNDIEFLVRVDEDDFATQEFLATRPRKIDTKIIIGGRGNGYADLHLMYNELCAISTGRFLFLWNDDATMLTPNWDNELRSHDDGKTCYVKSGVSDSRGRDQYLFPIVHRSYYECLGHFSLSAHNDTYLTAVFEKYGNAVRDTSIVVRHHALQIDDQTAIEAKKTWPVTKSVWGQPEFEQNLKNDIVKLGELLKKQGIAE